MTKALRAGQAWLDPLETKERRGHQAIKAIQAPWDHRGSEGHLEMVVFEVLLGSWVQGDHKA